MKLLLSTLLVFAPLTLQAEYLGNLSANEFDPVSIANPFGAGNPFSPNRVTNEFGTYGSPFSTHSAARPSAKRATINGSWNIFPFKTAAAAPDNE
jgi:hypothetical protein